MAKAQMTVDVEVTPNLRVSEYANRVIQALGDHSGVLLPTIKQLMAEAWDEGFADGMRQDAEGDDGPRFTNPYLEGEDS
jgi:hypothetical protein